MIRYNEVRDFIEKNHRNPSKYYDEEKLMNAGEMIVNRVERFKELLELSEQGMTNQK